MTIMRNGFLGSILALPLPDENLRRIYERIVAEMTAFEASAMSSK